MGCQIVRHRDQLLIVFQALVAIDMDDLFTGKISRYQRFLLGNPFSKTFNRLDEIRFENEPTIVFSDFFSMGNVILVSRPSKNIGSPILIMLHRYPRAGQRLDQLEHIIDLALMRSTSVEFLVPEIMFQTHTRLRITTSIMYRVDLQPWVGMRYLIHLLLDLFIQSLPLISQRIRELLRLTTVRRGME